MKRTPLVRKTPLQSRSQLARTPMRPTRTPRLTRAEAVLASSRVVVWERDMARCARCGAPGSDVHHRNPRGMGGASRSVTVHLPSNLVVVCRQCHRFLETTQRGSAILDGWIVRTGRQKPSEVPVPHHALGWVLLDDEGGTVPFPPPGGDLP